MHVYYNINNIRIVHIFHKMHILTQIKKNVIPLIQKFDKWKQNCLKSQLVVGLYFYILTDFLRSGQTLKKMTISFCFGTYKQTNVF